MTRVVKEDMIAAIATAPGEGGVAIVRVSGEGSLKLLKKVFRPKRPGEVKPYRMRYGHVISEGGEAIDEALCVYFSAPHTYTAENIVEIQCHGGTVQAKRVLLRVMEAGARLALPGEFTRRAFENGRISLPEAEAVLALVRSNGELAVKAAFRQLSGSVALLIAEIRENLTESLAMIEATIDFPDEVEEDAAEEKVVASLNKARHLLESAIDEKGARAVRAGASVVITGTPNVGKSSLLNAILKRERAIVSEIPGTTRDVLTETINIGGLMIELSDTAGQRASIDPIELIGISRAKTAQREADLVFLVFDAAREIDDYELELIREADTRVIVVVNKTDIGNAESIAREIEKQTGLNPICVSAATGEGIDRLLGVMKERLSGYISAEPTLINLRQIECAKAALSAIERALNTVSQSPLDIVSSDVWEALSALSALSGEDAREDVIDRIFQDFCVGK